MPEAKSVQEMLAERIQEEGLRTYLYTCAPYYTTLSLASLSKTFSLPLKKVTSILSKMIWNEELSASLDQSLGVVVFHRVELTRAQQLAQSVADRVSAMVEQNEKALDNKLGGGIWQDRNATSQGSKGADGGRTERRGGQSARNAPKGGRGARFAQGLGNRMSDTTPRPQVAA